MHHASLITHHASRITHHAVRTGHVKPLGQRLDSFNSGKTTELCCPITLFQIKVEGLKLAYDVLVSVARQQQYQDVRLLSSCWQMSRPLRF